VSGPKRTDPFFLVGDSRSGTTFLANLLIHHRAIGLAPESKFMLRLLDSFETQGIRREKDLETALDMIYRERKFLDYRIEREELRGALVPRLPLSFAEMSRCILRYYCDRHFPQCQVWGLKKGGRYILEASRLLGHFPEARFLHLIRDGRAVFNSKKKAIHSGSGRPLEANCVRAAEVWVSSVKAFEAFRERHPEHALEISYESLVTSLDDVLERIFVFLSVDPDPNIATEARGSLDPAYVVDRSRHLHGNVSKPPLPDRIASWRSELSDREQRVYEMVAGQVLEEKGYATQRLKADLLTTVSYGLRRSVKTLQRLLTGS
jgi:Sulfotransferase family